MPMDSTVLVTGTVHWVQSIQHDSSRVLTGMLHSSSTCERGCRVRVHVVSTQSMDLISDTMPRTIVDKRHGEKVILDFLYTME